MILTDVLAGWPGSVHDSRVLRNSSLFATSANKFPGDYHIIGDGGYPLLRYNVEQIFFVMSYMFNFSCLEQFSIFYSSYFNSSIILFCPLS